MRSYFCSPLARKVTGHRPSLLRLRLYPFYEACGLWIRALTHQGRNRDFVSDHLVDIPHDDPIHAGAFDITDLQLGLDHRDVAGYVLADDLESVLSRHAALQFLLDCGFANTGGPA